MTVRILDTIEVAKPWGRDSLPAPFEKGQEERIGEIWFDPPAEWPDVLVKYLFTSDKLSVQVHPDDARAPEGSRGKEECWLVLDAEPGATLAAGFREETDPATMRASALDGSIEERLEWHKVGRGDFFYLPAGTVHAIGAGLSILEVQQNSDITYRLFDYGRPRELHLDESVAVADGGPYPDSLHRKVDFAASAQVVDERYFKLDLVAASDAPTIDSGSGCLILPLAGEATAGEVNVTAGQCAFIDGNCTIGLSEDAEAVVVRRPG